MNKVMFIDYATTVKLLSVSDAMNICEDVYAMHARGSVDWSDPPSQHLDTPKPFFNHWHVKTVILKEAPVAGVRMYSYVDDGVINNVGQLDCTRFIVISDPKTGQPLAILDEHWTYAIRSAAASVLPLKWLGPKSPRVLGLIGVGTMGVNCLRCLVQMYKFEEILCTSRRPETREAFAKHWTAKLGIKVTPVSSVEEVVRGSDISVGGTTRTDIVSYEHWVKKGGTFISLARREMDPAGWGKFDKVVIDNWDVNLATPEFRDMLNAGQFNRSMLHSDIAGIVTGEKAGRESQDERILIHTTGMVSLDIGLAHWVYKKALETGAGIPLPTAVEQAELGPKD
jgi:ornithine cyclodeaminase